MNYHENEILLHAYLDNELDTTTSLELLEHAMNCTTCQSRLEAFSSLKANLRKSLPHYSVSQNLRRTILSNVQPKTRLSWPKIFHWSMPIAVSLALGVWIWIVLTIPKDYTNDLVWDHIHALKSGHLMEVVSSDKHTVKPWFAGKTDFSPFVVDLAANGFPLLGARAENIDGYDIAALVYSNGKHYLALYEWPSSDRLEASAGTFRGFNTISFLANGMRCYLVSDASKDELERFHSMLITSLNGR